MVNPREKDGDNRMVTKISVVICTRDRADLIGAAIESVAACDYRAFDLSVMDQSTNSDTEAVVNRLRESLADRCAIHYQHFDKAGLSRAYNAGFRATDAPIVACTDDDVVVPSDWLTRIAAAFDDDPGVGLLYGQVLVPASLAHVPEGTIVPSLVWADRQRLHETKRNFKVWGMGANMAIRRVAMDDVGGFDEIMGGGAPLRSSQDFDFALRMYRKGYAVLLDPDVQVDHYGARSADQWPGTLVAYGIGDGAFYGKHMRCRDLLVWSLFLRKVARLVAKSVYDAGRSRRLPKLDDYGRNIFTGLKQGARYDVDRTTRLYAENDRALGGVTEANAVAGAGHAG
jgi:GT2 family glycosyltransferase